jgi:transposase
VADFVEKGGCCDSEIPVIQSAQLAGLKIMMGHRQVEQAALFYEFSLEKHVPADHLLRSIDRFVDLEEVRRGLAPFYSSIGRPSVDPELMIRMLLVGYCFGIRSERRLCDEVHLNLAYRWFCRLGLDGAVPDHSTFSKNRHGRFRESDLFRRVFESVLRRCMEERLVGGEGFAVDASLIKADANRQKGIEGDKGLPPEATGRAIDEYLAVLDDAAFGAATEVTPKFVSPADPAARWTGAHGGQAFFAYSTNYLVDVENAIIVDVEATTAIRQAEVLAAKRMIERSLERFDLYPSRLLGDSGYGSAQMLGWLVYEHGIEPHVTVFDKSARTDGTFSREDFTYDHAGDVYRCPGGKILTTTGALVNDGATLLYVASKRDCDRCALKAQCCPKQASRKVPRSIYEGARDMARQIARSWEGRTSRRLRKKIEMLFAHLKRILKLDRLRLRGPNGARDEFTLAATAQNLRKMAKLIPMQSLKPA